MFSFRRSPTKDKILWLTSPDHIAQAILIFIPMWFGVILATHWNTFETSRSFYVMQKQMTEEHWALWSVTVAIVSIFCWATNNRYMMIFQNSLLMSWHGLVALCIFLANPITPGSGTFAILAFAATVRAINLSLSPADNWR